MRVREPDQEVLDISGFGVSESSCHCIVTQAENTNHDL